MLIVALGHILSISNSVFTYVYFTCVCAYVSKLENFLITEQTSSFQKWFIVTILEILV